MDPNFNPRMPPPPQGVVAVGESHPTHKAEHPAVFASQQGPANISRMDFNYNPRLPPPPQGVVIAESHAAEHPAAAVFPSQQMRPAFPIQPGPFYHSQGPAFPLQQGPGWPAFPMHGFPFGQAQPPFFTPYMNHGEMFRSTPPFFNPYVPYYGCYPSMYQHALEEGPSKARPTVLDKEGPSTSTAGQMEPAQGGPSTSKHVEVPNAGPSTSKRTEVPNAGPSTSKQEEVLNAGPSTSKQEEVPNAGPSTSKQEEVNNARPSTSSDPGQSDPSQVTLLSSEDDVMPLKSDVETLSSDFEERNKAPKAKKKFFSKRLFRATESTESENDDPPPKKEKKAPHTRPTPNEQAEEECIICFKKLTSTTEIAWQVGCQFHFNCCLACGTTWFLEKKCCYVCRRPVEDIKSKMFFIARMDRKYGQKS